MTEHVESRFRLSLYEELDDIVSAMKNLAQVELHRLKRAELERLSLQQGVARALALANQHLHPWPVSEQGLRVLLVIGSERGFCGGFNEQLVRHLADGDLPFDQLWLQGARLAGKREQLGELQVGERVFSGINSADEVLLAVETLLEPLVAVRLARVEVLMHGPGGIEQRCLWPVEAVVEPQPRTVSLVTYVEDEQLWFGLYWQALEAGLILALTQSLLQENRLRLQQMDGARDHLQELTQQLKLRINAQRQRDIVEEIEVILSEQFVG